MSGKLSLEINADNIEDLEGMIETCLELDRAFEMHIDLSEMSVVELIDHWPTLDRVIRAHGPKLSEHKHSLKVSGQLEKAAKVTHMRNAADLKSYFEKRGVKCPIFCVLK